MSESKYRKPGPQNLQAKNSRSASSGGNKDRMPYERQQQNMRQQNPKAQGSYDSGRGSGGLNVTQNRLSGTAFTDLELDVEIPKKKFTGRCRLYVGNLPHDVQESELKELFTPHGDISECYLSGKGFAFLRLDTRAHAESAKEALDGKNIRNRTIRVRFAVHGAAIKIKELPPVISNEMLFLTFSAFGEVERAIHIVDEKGRPTGEGIIEFERKTSAQDALAQIRDKVLLLTANSRPLQVEMLEPKDDEDGFCEKMIQRTPALIKERELGPRFAAVNSFEFVYGQKWKQLYDMERARRQELDMELKEARRRLDADMEIAYEDYKAQLLREDLQRRQLELERLEASRRARMQHMQPPQLMGGGPPKFGGQNMDRNSLVADRAMLEQRRNHNSPPIMDGPLGRNPPTFGGPGAPQRSNGGPSPMMGGGGGSGPMMGGGRPQGDQPDVSKLMQTFRESIRYQQQPPQLQQQQPPLGGYNAFIGGGAGSNAPPPPPPGRQPPPPPAFRHNPMEMPPEKRMRH